MLAVQIPFVLSGCENTQPDDFCRNHYAFHSDHIDTVANLSIDIASSGLLIGELQLPSELITAGARDDVIATLRKPENTFTLETERECSGSKVTALSDANGVNVLFEANCGIDNRLGQVNVAVFDHVAGLEEAVVTVTTPATMKRFAISRQCEAAIFRIDPPGKQ